MNILKDIRNYLLAVSLAFGFQPLAGLAQQNSSNTSTKAVRQSITKDRSWAVGRYTAKHALLWDKDGVTNLGNLGAKLWITPMALNQRGDIVGFGATSESDVNGDYLRAFIWTLKDGMKRIDPLPITDHVYSQANGINESGQVVGSSCTFDGACLGFLWQNGVIKNLNDPNVTPGFNGVIISLRRNGSEPKFKRGLRKKGNGRISR